MRSALILPLLTTILTAQNEAPDTFGHSRHGDTFDEGPRQAAYLMAGLSDQVHFPVDGLSDAAQRFFDQGITQQHGFWHFEAERSFRQVALLHPDCALAYWGMAMANVENAERAAGFIANAVERGNNATPREQRWIDAWAADHQIDDKARDELQSADGERIEAAKLALVEKNKQREKKLLDALDKQLIKDLGTIVYEYPDDIEAKAFLAVQMWLAYRWGSGIPIVSHTAVDALLQQVFEKAPLHPAHHYVIHLWDSEDAARALASAAKNGSTASAIAHQWHMSGHIYAKLHRHAAAAWQQEASSRTDHAQMMRDRVMPFLIHNYGHNQEWLARSLSHVGRIDEALAIAKNLAELPRHPKYNRVDAGDDIANYGMRRLVQICEDHGRWQQAIELCEHGYLEQNDEVASEVQRLGLLGRAYFRLDRLDAAERVVADVGELLAKARSQRAAAIDNAEAKAHREKVKREAMRTAIADAGRKPSNSVQSVLDLQRELAGERLLASGDAEAALAEFEAVTGLPKPLLADAQVAAGQPDKAIELLTKEVEKNPGRTAPMAALLRALDAKLAVDETPETGEQRRDLVDDLSALAGVGYLERVGIEVDAGVATTDASSVAAVAEFGPDFGERPPLDTLGPRCWSPVANPGFELPVAVTRELTNFQISMTLNPDGTRPVDLFGSKKPGRATLVVFYLGFGCVHCIEQLQALRPLADEFTAIGVDVVAIGTDTVAATRRAHEALPREDRLPFPLLADTELTTFKTWRCYDDFEQMPLHGTFLVDGSGKVRWQDIWYEPFTEIEWLVRESRRLLALPAEAPSQVGRHTR